FPALNHTKQFGQKKTEAQATGDRQGPQEVIESGQSVLESTKSILPFIVFIGVILLFVGGYKLVSTVIESEVTSQKSKDLGPKIESSSALNIDSGKAEEPKEEEPAEPEVKAEATPVEEAKPEPKEEISVKPEPTFQRNFPTVEFRPIRGKLFSMQTDAPENTDPQVLPDSIKSKINP